jgi:hypothetical protein
MSRPNVRAYAEGDRSARGAIEVFFYYLSKSTLPDSQDF